jgi:transcriptional antiterminator RfaH
MPIDAVPSGLVDHSGFNLFGLPDRGALRWFAVQCRPNQEHRAAAHLLRQSFTIFLPCREKLRKHARKVERIRAPFFPGYLFIRLDLTRDRWRSVNNTSGVARLVMQGDHPTAAPVGVVEALIDLWRRQDLLDQPPALRPGETIRILTGPFADFVGKLDAMTEAGRVRVLLDMMGGSMPVLLPLSSVAACASTP